jgi:hypothetical protein
MDTKENPKSTDMANRGIDLYQPSKHDDILFVSILTALVLCIGLYRIGTTVVIAKDGTTFIEYSKNLAISPLNTFRTQEQHPGYPFLILMVHRAAEFAGCEPSIQSWIYSAQYVTLLFRLFAVITLYFLAKHIIGNRFAFYAVLILIFLPKPADYGSDALSDWPHLFFVLLGFLLLLLAAKNNKGWLFGTTGLVVGMGYLVRPECAQVVIYGVLWLGLQLCYAKTGRQRRLTAVALLLLLTGFLIPAAPYMKIKGAIFPKKHVLEFASNITLPQFYKLHIPDNLNNVSIAGFVPQDIMKAFCVLFESVGDLLMWFFVPFLVLGLWDYFRRRIEFERKHFFVAILILFNVFLLSWLYHRFGYISQRHVLPLTAIMVFFVPQGLRATASLLQAKLSGSPFFMKADQKIYFFVLMALGIGLCIPKLIRPSHYDKADYLAAACWLKDHTNEQDIVMVPDLRISFYAERKGVKDSSVESADGAKHRVLEVRKGHNLQEEIVDAGRIKKLLSGMTQVWRSDENEKGVRLVIYAAKKE